MKERDEWVAIHDYLQDVIERMRFDKGSNGYIKMRYYGDADNLRRACIRILNTLDRLEAKAEEPRK